MAAIPVKVAVRCRPLCQKEIDEGDQICVQFPSNEPMIIVGKKPFTFSYVFSPEVCQEAVYEETVLPLVGNIIKGYNATVLAYGQTGSGKTYTMGGAYSGVDVDDTTGIIPRVLSHLFDKFAEKDTHTFSVNVSYLEIYNEEVHDLLNVNGKDTLSVREDANGIKIPGLKEIAVDNYETTMKCLENGTMARTTAATAMNQVSSRSHAIFTLHIDITNKNNEAECYKTKLHLVDLAGSERIKKTHAEGNRLKEGININKGLLSLGNVISSLGEDAKHIPYRDSKLTRLLQDSLGGNSYTLMIACISPADSNMEETLNSLRYADRASKIKNKPLVNHDPKVAEILTLKNQLTQLQMELISVTGGKTNNTEGYKELQVRVKDLEKQNDDLTKELHGSLTRSAQQMEQIIQLESQRDDQKVQLDSLLELCGKLTEKNNNDNEEDVSLKENYKNMKTNIETRANSIQQVFGDTSIEDSENQSMESGEMESQTPDSRQLTTQHTLKQAAMSRELNELNTILAKKQHLAQSATTNLCELRSKFEADKQELEVKISALLEEKADLQCALSSAKTSKVEKLSEKRRQKLKDLEQEVTRLKKEMLDKQRSLRLKEQSEKQIINLNSEIQGLKSQRVKLMKRMKEDSDVFRKWKLQKDKEVNQLMQKDRKRQFEMQKLQKNHDKQQAILKRKSEEASAANKRLKEAMSRQKAVRLDRQHQFDVYGASKNAQSIKVVLEREVDVKVSLQETKHYLKTLMTDRALLHSQVKVLKEQLTQPPKKKSALSSNDSTQSADDSYSRKEIQEQIKMLTEDIRIRNIQITEIQNKIQDAELDKSKPCWETLHSMNEAKVVLKSLFEKTVSEKVKALLLEGEVKEMNEGKVEFERNLKRKSTQVESITKVFENEKIEIQQKYENKVMRLLKQVRRVTDEDPNVTIDDETRTKVEEQESHEDTISNLNEQVNKMAEEIRGYKRMGMHTPDLFDPEEFSSDSADSDWVTPYVKKARKIIHKNKSCGCKLNCRGARCGCVKQGRPCGPGCKCDGKCSNGGDKENNNSDGSEEGNIINPTPNKPEGLNSTFNSTAKTLIFPPVIE